MDGENGGQTRRAEGHGHLSCLFRARLFDRAEMNDVPLASPGDE
jgi:hypothetical protein